MRYYKSKKKIARPAIHNTERDREDNMKKHPYTFNKNAS